MNDITEALVRFRNERDWEQFHDPRNLALAISLEAAELNELFLWKKDGEIDSISRDRVKEELADVFAYAFLMAERYGFDVRQIVMDKIEANGRKYPVDKAKGNARKYSEL